jgi:glycosyltransferase involved in cell wall biosynthesis
VQRSGQRTPTVGGGTVFVAWSRRTRRTREIAAAIGAEPWCFDPRFLPGPRSAPLRWTWNAVGTLRRLRRERPALVIVTNPPVFAAVVVALWCARSGARFVLDSHPGGFGAQGDRVAARLQRLHRWAVRRAVVTMVTAPAWVERVEAWGGRGIVVHEATPPWAPTPWRPDDGPLRVLFVTVFAPDEPVAAVLEAAGHLPGVEIHLTGDPARCPAELRAAAPSSVRFLGYLDDDAYLAALEQADIVLALTTEPTSVMRAAAEAVHAERPLVASGWDDVTAAFPSAVPVAVDHGPAAIAAAIAEAVARIDELRADAPAARARQVAVWEHQRRDLLAALGRLQPPPVGEATAGMEIGSAACGR